MPTASSWSTEMVRETADRGGIVLIATHDPERSNGVVDGWSPSRRDG
jgi:ABC-type transport system involved in cytochrome c biogenesis ATPase subunit